MPDPVLSTGDAMRCKSHPAQEGLASRERCEKMLIIMVHADRCCDMGNTVCRMGREKWSPLVGVGLVLFAVELKVRDDSGFLPKALIVKLTFEREF